MRQFFIVVFITFCTLCSSQDSIDSLIRVNRRINYYVNVQTNLLLQQFLNFNSNISNPNPYMFNVTLTDKYSGNGLLMGTGLTASNNFSNDGIVEITDDRINLATRFGFEKKMFQWRKIIPLFGAELGFGYTEQRLKTKLIQTITNSETSSKTTKLFFGPALRGGLIYKITNELFIGTEFYFNLQLSINKTVVVTNNPQIPTQTQNRTSLPIDFGFQAPTALLLGYKF
ncbi:MAG: hypothetical protein ACK5QC_12685 [Bacteroidota bacterium]